MLTAIFLSTALHASELPEPTAGQDQARFIRERTHQLKDLQVAEITVKEKTKMKVWVMDVEAKRQEGMMFVRDADWTESQGMIFVFSDEMPLRFWMKNTYVPLDIAYIDQDGVITTTYTMNAFDTTTDFSTKRDSMYALEVKAGLWKKLGVKAGDKVVIPKTVKAKE